MVTIQDILPTDNGADSLVKIEENFSNLNAGKVENSALNDFAYICNDQHSITNYTFTGSERRNGGYLCTTPSANTTINIDADLFVTGTEFLFCKGTNNAYTITLDAGSGNNINGSQTLVLDIYNEFVQLIKDGANTWKAIQTVPKSTINGKAPINNPSLTGTLEVNGQNWISAWTSFTPTLIGDTGSATIGTIQFCKIQPRGKQLEIVGRFSFTKNTMSGTVKMGVLGYTFTDSTLKACIADQGSSTLYNPLMLGQAGGSYITFEKQMATSVIVASDLGAGTIWIWLNGTLEIA